MKYLYKIFRLLFCPHKYKKSIAAGKVTIPNIGNVGNWYDRECNYCGKVKRFECSL